MAAIAPMGRSYTLDNPTPWVERRASLRHPSGLCQP